MFLKISFCLKYLFIQYTDGDKNRVLHKKSFLCNTQSLTDFSRAPRRDIFSKIGMGNVRGITKNVPNLQVYEHTPATPTTLSIKVVIVVLY